MPLQGGLCTNWKVEVHPFSTRIHPQHGRPGLPSWHLQRHRSWGLSAFAFTPRQPTGPGGCGSVLVNNTSWAAAPGRAQLPADDRQLKLVQGGLKGKEKKKKVRERHVTSHCALVTLAELWSTALLNAESSSDNPVGEWYGKDEACLRNAWLLSHWHFKFCSLF